MLTKQLSRLYRWSQRQRRQRQARRRIAELEQRLVAHEQDMAAMEGFPNAVQKKMWAYRVRLKAQIEQAKQYL